MDPRQTRTTVTFRHPVRLPGQEELPAGSYDFLIEEERLQGLSFEAFHRTASWLVVGGAGRPTELRLVTPQDLEAALARDLGDPGGGRA